MIALKIMCISAPVHGVLIKMIPFPGTGSSIYSQSVLNGVFDIFKV